MLRTRAAPGPRSRSHPCILTRRRREFTVLEIVRKLAHQMQRRSGFIPPRARGQTQHMQCTFMSCANAHENTIWGRDTPVDDGRTAAAAARDVNCERLRRAGREPPSGAFRMRRHLYLLTNSRTVPCNDSPPGSSISS
eukprot:6193086-Pleurochrysis_carterae.AAC.5